MRIDVKCYATLARFAPPDAEALELPDGATVAEVVRRLAIPEDEVKLLFVNGVHAAPDAVLRDGDRLGVFPPVGGG